MKIYTILVDVFARPESWKVLQMPEKSAGGAPGGTPPFPFPGFCMSRVCCFWPKVRLPHTLKENHTEVVSEEAAFLYKPEVHIYLGDVGFLFIPPISSSS